MSFFRKYSSKYILEPLFWRYKNMPINSIYRQYISCQFDTAEKLYERQTIALSRILKHALTAIPIYRDAVDGVSLSDIARSPWDVLQQLPIVQKSDLNRDISMSYVDIGRGLIENATGGSTGEPFRIYQDSFFKSHTFATTKLFYHWSGRESCEHLVKIWGAERDLVSGKYGLKQYIVDVINNQKMLNAFNMSSDRMHQYVDVINKNKPLIIEGYADALFEFSKFIESRGIAIHNPKSIVSSAGQLHSSMRTKIESVFNAPVFNRYGSREAGNMAAECDKHMGMHVFGETTIIEIVDENNVVVDDGVEGDIVVTNLTNYTMPLIRYKIGDKGAYADSPCKCGRPYKLLKYISGRSGDALRSTDGSLVLPEFISHLMGVMHNDDVISKFQIVQEQHDLVVLRLVLKSGFQGSQWGKQKSIIALLKKVFGKECEIKVIFENYIELTATGKHLYTVSKI